MLKLRYGNGFGLKIRQRFRLKDMAKCLAGPFSVHSLLQGIASSMSRSGSLLLLLSECIGRKGGYVDEVKVGQFSQTGNIKPDRVDIPTDITNLHQQF
jgi:hypothetical protein